MPGAPSTDPIPVRRALRKLGQDLRDARRRRRIPVELMAERASMSRTTLSRIEQGHAGVSLGNYARVLFVLGMVDRLAELADVRSDAVGLALAEEELPQRIRRRRDGSSWRAGEPERSGRESREDRTCRKGREDRG